MISDLLLFRSALRDAVRPRRLFIALLVTLLPPLVGLAWRLLTPAADFVPSDVYDSLVPGLIFSFSLTILSVVYGTGVISQELEQRTIVYLLTRPLPRWRILLARFAASLLVVMTITAASVLLLAVIVYGPKGFSEAGVWLDVRALLIGALAYGALFLLLGATTPRPLIYGLLFVFGWETWVPALPGAFARISVMSYLRVLSSREIGGGEQSGDAGGNFLLAFSNPPEMNISQNQAWLILVLTAVIALLGALLAFSRREYAPRDDSE